MEIKNRWSGEVVYKSELSTLREAVLEAIQKGANLVGADLVGADLRYANLRGANLGDANLRDANLQDAYLRGADLRSADLGYADLGGANLGGANLGGANLRGANLRGANLRGADLRGANLGGANLRCANLGDANLRGADLWSADLGYADLRYADLRYANLPAPTTVLLASWGDVSPELCADLMLFDAANHPDPKAFDFWAINGPCPYADVKVQRAANFTERRELWGKGKECRPYDLMIRVLAERCPDWTDEQVAAFEAKFKKPEEK